MKVTNFQFSLSRPAAILGLTYTKNVLQAPCTLVCPLSISVPCLVEVPQDLLSFSACFLLELAVASQGGLTSLESSSLSLCWWLRHGLFLCLSILSSSSNSSQWKNCPNNGRSLPSFPFNPRPPLPLDLSPSHPDQWGLPAVRLCPCPILYITDGLFCIKHGLAHVTSHLQACHDFRKPAG